MSFEKEIELSEFPMILSSATIVRVCGFDKISEPAKVQGLSVHHDTGLIFLIATIPVDTLIARGIIGSLGLITLILALRGEAEIVASVIKSVAVLVVNLYARRGLHNPPVHFFLEFAWSRL
jgi:hypothetical protein